MLILSSTSDLVTVTATTAATLEVHASWMDNASGTITPGRTNTATISSTTETTIVAAAASGSQRNVKHLSVFNDHASTTATIDVQHTDGSNKHSLCKAVLLAGERVIFDQEGDWIHYDSNGGPYPSVGNAATQGDMEAGTATNKYVTPQSFNWHPGAAKAWAKMAVSAGVPGLTVSWNMTSVTDSAVCRVTPVIATDFSSTNYCVSYGFECNTTTYSATTTALIQCIRNGTQTATQFAMDLLEIDIGQTTDPTAWHFACWGDQA